MKITKLQNSKEAKWPFESLDLRLWENYGASWGSKMQRKIFMNLPRQGK